MIRKTHGILEGRSRNEEIVGNDGFLAKIYSIDSKPRRKKKGKMERGKTEGADRLPL